jgi:hypothetical protein
MDREAKPAVVFVRMSPQLRDGLRVAADDAGCSLNAFVVQVLAAAAGDPSRFRTSRTFDAGAETDIERDWRGFPLTGRARMLHISARCNFIDVTTSEVGFSEMVRLVRSYDAEDPGYFVEWQRLRTIEREARIREGRRAAA